MRQNQRQNQILSSIPSHHAGIGLRGPHYQEVAFDLPDSIQWLEIHSENFFCHGGMSKHILDNVAQHYPLSFHGVGLSLGSADHLNRDHLQHIKQLVNTYQPALVSEHISWSSLGDTTINDLLPLPYTFETLDSLTDHVNQFQDTINRSILVENPSTYLAFKDKDMEEYELLAELSQRTGCGILLDINNLYVTHKNHGTDPIRYFEHLSDTPIGEMHLAGHAVRMINDQPILIDHHGDFVCDEVWKLYQTALNHFGPVPTLIEWDTDIPSLQTLILEAEKAQAILDQCL